MKIEIKKGTHKYIINLSSITQMIGTNFYIKNYIIDSIIKHFSNAKYLDFEEEKIDNILSDNKTLGRKYFSTYLIKNIDNVIDNIHIGKTTLMFKYLNYLMADFDCQQDMYDIDSLLQKLYTNINHKLNKNIENINITYNIDDIINALAKSEVFTFDNEPLYTMSHLSLIVSYIQLIRALYDQTPNKILLIFENIDHYLSKNQYDLLLDRIFSIIDHREIYILFTSSIDNYVKVSKELLTGINVVNDDIFNVPNIESIMDFIDRTYPSSNTLDECAIYNILPYMLNNVYKKDYEIQLQNLILLILFNKTLSIDTKNQKVLNNIEFSFLNKAL